MTAECKPPAGTPDGTVFVLARDNASRGVLHMWHADGWWRRCRERYRMHPTMMGRLGWRIATPLTAGKKGEG